MPGSKNPLYRYLLEIERNDHALKKLYIGLSLFLLFVLLSVGLWTVAVGGIPEIGLQILKNGEYAPRFHSSLVEAFPGEETLGAWNRTLNQFYSFTGFASEEVQLLIPIINDGADHGAHYTDTDLSTSDDGSLDDNNDSDAPSDDINIEDEPEMTEVTESDSLIMGEEEPAAQALGQILLLGNRAMELPDADYDTIGTYSEAVSAIAEALDGVEVYSLLVPNSAGLYAPEAYQQGEDSQKNMIDYAYSSMDERIRKVDAYSILEEYREDYLYFRTDHHWTHLGSYYAYRAFCEEAGLTAKSLVLFETVTYETFLGTMYSFLSGYPQREVLREDPDSLTYYVPEREVTVHYYDSANLSYGSEIDMIYSLPENYSNKYISFLGGDHPITILETEQQEERVCLLIKESYGNAFATWPPEHYSKIICIDPREFNRNGKPSLDLQEFARAQGVDDCIILNYPLMINSSAYSAWLGRLVS